MILFPDWYADVLTISYQTLKSPVWRSGIRIPTVFPNLFFVPSSRKSLKIHGKTVHLDSGLMALPYHCQGIFQKNLD